VSPRPRRAAAPRDPHRRHRGLVVGGLLLALFGAEPLAAWLAGLAAVVVRSRPLSWRACARTVAAWGYTEREDDLLIRSGVLMRRLVVVPYGRMQFVDVGSGPLARSFGVATVQLHTASAGHRRAHPRAGPRRGSPPPRPAGLPSARPRRPACDEPARSSRPPCRRPAQRTVQRPAQRPTQPATPAPGCATCTADPVPARLGASRGGGAGIGQQARGDLSARRS
jgi:hypothetical protein